MLPFNGQRDRWTDSGPEPRELRLFVTATAAPATPSRGSKASKASKAIAAEDLRYLLRCDGQPLSIQRRCGDWPAVRSLLELGFGSSRRYLRNLWRLFRAGLAALERGTNAAVVEDASAYFLSSRSARSFQYLSINEFRYSMSASDSAE